MGRLRREDALCLALERLDVGHDPREDVAGVGESEPFDYLLVQRKAGPR